MIKQRSEGEVRVVTLARPERRNALDRTALRDLQAAVEGATEPVVYLRGAGEAFCAGADLSVVDSLDRGEAIEFARLGQRVARAVETADAVVVAGVDGPARGGGVELAVACDLRVATPDATFAETGVQIGLFGAWGGTARLPELLPEAVASDLALSGRTVDAQEALRVGLVSRVCEHPREVADELAANDDRALATIKRRLRDRSSTDRQHRREATAFGTLVQGRNERS